MDSKNILYLVYLLITIQLFFEVKPNNTTSSYTIPATQCESKILETGQIVSQCTEKLQICVNLFDLIIKGSTIAVRYDIQSNTAITVSDLLSTNNKPICGTLRQLTILYDSSQANNCSSESSVNLMGKSFLHEFTSVKFLQIIIQYPPRNELACYAFNSGCITHLAKSNRILQDFEHCIDNLILAKPVRDYDDLDGSSIANLTKSSAFEILKNMADDWLFLMNGRISSLELRLTSSGEVPPIFIEVSYVTNIKDYIDKLILKESGYVNITVTHVTEPYNSMKVLDFSKNKITTMDPKFLSMFPNLEMLDMSNNLLTTLPPGLHSLKHLLELRIDENNLKFGLLSEQDFRTLQRISSLSLNSIPFTEVDVKALKKISHVRKLFLSNCSLSFIPIDLFINFRNLTHLDLSDNQLSNFPILSNLSTLKYLNLSRNSFDKMENVVNYSEKEEDADCETSAGCNSKLLDVLDLSNNKITSWKENAFPVYLMISWLNLTFNKITEFHIPMMDDFEKIEHVLLEGNPIDCSSCVLPDFQNWILTKTNDSEFKNLICDLPLLFHNKLLLHVQPNLESCSASTSNTEVYIIISAIVIVLGIVFAGVCYGLKWYLTVASIIRTKLHLAKQPEGNRFEYDAFVSYCSPDEEWILKELIPNTEIKYQYKLCLHERNFLVGEYIVDNIIYSIDRSRKVIFILTNSFLKSKWCQWELRMAHHKMFEADGKILILVKLAKLEKSKITKTLRNLLNNQTYLKWGETDQEQKLFWSRLKDSLGKPLKSNEKEAKV